VLTPPKVTSLFITLLLVLMACSADRTEKKLTLSAVPPGMRLVFSDEFNDGVVDTNKWALCYPWTNRNGCYNARTGERQSYLPRNVTERDGSLRLTARKETVNGRPYTSGMISSHKSFRHRYGYLEARIKFPKGKGMWGAFWNLPYPVSWPPEIDVVEVLGRAPSRAEFHYHYGTRSNHLQSGRSHSGPDLTTGFHTYAVRWQNDLIIWYLDGVERYRFKGTRVSEKSMYILLNLAVGGSWAGTPDATTPWPTTMYVDWVRVYQARP
jgi:beta-glucanase (GH16 family)